MDKKTNGKIFVVDDDEAILEAVGFCLGDEGYEVKAVKTAENIRASIVAFGPQLILLDLYLAGHSGKDIAYTLKNDSKTAHIPIIMFSAHPTGAEEAKTLGIAGYLAKPFTTEDLFATVKTHLLPS